MSQVYIGANVFEHDSAVFLVLPDSKRVSAISTERVTRFKHDKLFCFPAIETLIRNENLDRSSITDVFIAHTFTTRKKAVCWSDEYEVQIAERAHSGALFQKDFNQYRQTYARKSTLGKIWALLLGQKGRYLLWQKMLRAMRIVKKIPMEELVSSKLKLIFPKATIHHEYFDHQRCHAVASYYSSPYNNAMLFTYDGWGDDLFSRAISVTNGKLKDVAASACAHIAISATGYPRIILGSPAGIYAYVTHLLGFIPVSEEGKVEALAAYGKKDEQLYTMFMSLFSVNKETHALDCDTIRATTTLQLDSMRQYVERLSREDLAASVQDFLNDITCEYVTHLLKATGHENICLSGGATANVIMNLSLYERVTKNIHITPAMADDGTAQGAALLSLKEHGHSTHDLEWLKGEVMPYYGTLYSKEQIVPILEKYKDRIKWKDLTAGWHREVAKRIAHGEVGALYHGRMEWGPRALGNRSIVADARSAGLREKINKTIKKRPLFQPFCPSILAEEASRLFEDSYHNKHMTCAFRLRKEYWDKLPSAIHVDGTARVQFVAKQDNPDYFQLLTEVRALTGFGVIINTSFNKHGRTIVEKPEHAIVDFLDTDLDYLLIEGMLVERNDEN